MDKKEKIFRNVISNSVIGLVIIATLFVTLNMSPVSTTSGGNTAFYKGNSKTHVSLMVNVYWGTEYIEPMLDVMRKHNVKTTFFVGGIWAEKNEDLLRRIYDDGHEIGNHGYLHKDHKALDLNSNYNEMNVTHLLVKGILGVDMTLFAPPSGSFGEKTLVSAEKMKYKTIMWSLDTIDWRDQNTDLIFSRATKKITAGDLVLMHPTKSTAQVLDKIITEIHSKNLQIAPVSDVLTGGAV